MDSHTTINYKTMDSTETNTNGHESMALTAPTESTETNASAKWRKLAVRILVASLIISFIVYAIIDASPNGDKNISRISREFLQWVEENPTIGVLAFIGVYVVATVLFIPGSVLTLGSGFIFAKVFGLGIGVLLATLAVFVGASLGAIISFLLGRYLMREFIEKNLSHKYPVFQAIDSALEQNGFRIIFLMRLSPIIPFNAINYLLGVTAVPLRSYILSCMGMLPGTLLYVYVGSSAGSLIDSESSANNNKTLTIVGIVVGVLFGVGAVAATAFYAKKELKKIIDLNEDAVEDVDGDDNGNEERA